MPVKRVRVCPYLRRRIPRQRIVIQKKGYKIPPYPYRVTIFEGERLGTTIDIRGRMAGRQPGVSYVFLPEHVRSLMIRARRHGTELKEAHIRDDIIETIIHENIHAWLAVDVPEASGSWHEEKVVDKITREVMEDIRELPAVR